MQIEAGMVLSGKVTAVTTFGAFVELPGGKSGLIHISEISSKFVANVSDHLKMGQVVNVKVVSTDDGKISLSIKRLEGDEAESRNRAEREPGHGKKVKKRAERPRNTNPPEEFDFGRKNDSDMSFDDMLKRFKRDSDEKFQDLKRSHDNKRSGGYKRAY